MSSGVFSNKIVRLCRGRDEIFLVIARMPGAALLLIVQPRDGNRCWDKKVQNCALMQEKCIFVKILPYWTDNQNHQCLVPLSEAYDVDFRCEDFNTAWQLLFKLH